MKKILEYMKNRTNIPYIIGCILLLTGLFAYPYWKGIDVSAHIAKNTPLMTLGLVIMMIPLFINSTRATLRSDLIDPKVVPEIGVFFQDFSNYDTDTLKMSLIRLYLEIADQRSYSMKNLALGFGLTIVAITLAVNIVFVSRDLDVNVINESQYLLFYLFPRLGAILFIQLIATLFFRWYGKNIQRIEQISDKMLLIELKKSVMNVSDKKEVLDWMSQVDLIALKTPKKKQDNNNNKIIQELIHKIPVNLVSK